MAPPPGVRDAILELNARVAWALDRQEFDALRTLFTPEMYYVGIGGEFRAVDDLIASFRTRIGTRTTRHGLGNLHLEARDDHTVAGLSCWHTFAMNGDYTPGVNLYMVADFHDVYARLDDGTWRIAERIIRPVFRDPRFAPASPTVSTAQTRRGAAG